MATETVQLMTKLEEIGAALWRFGQYLNSPTFYELSLYVGVHISALVFSIFGVIMITLLLTSEPPRPRTHILWTWIVLSLAFFLIRAVVILHWGDDGRTFIFAMAWWNLILSGLTALAVYATKALHVAQGKTGRENA